MNCPVCGVRLSDDGRNVETLGGEMSIAGFSSVHGDVTYWFDSQECKTAFDAEKNEEVDHAT